MIPKLLTEVLLQHFDTFTLVVIPMLIFLSRIVDVTFGTLRIIFVSRGMRYLAAFVGSSRCWYGSWP
ncbi:MAG: hypothetical protein P8Z70_05475 [Desulfuromonadales bacterium]|jgi:hypothetical protein